jgi:hypothetical protein
MKACLDENFRRDRNERGSRTRSEEVPRWRRSIERIGNDLLHHLSKLFERGDGATIMPLMIENHVPLLASMFINNLF